MERRKLIVAAIVAVLVINAGALATLSPEPRYESTASFVLVPAPNENASRSGLLESFQRSGTAGTYVELLAASDTLRSADATSVDVTVRHVPDTRVIQVTVRGKRSGVVPALEAIEQVARREQQRLGDLWQLQRLAGASRPERAGPSAPMLLAAAIMLGLLAGLLTLVAFDQAGRRFAARPAAGEPGADPEPANPGPNANGVHDHERSRLTTATR